MTGGTADAPFQDVWVYDLSSGSSYPIYGRSEFESNITRASLAIDILVVTILEYVDTAGQPIDLTTPFEAGSGTDFESPVVQAILSPDGSTLMYAQIQNVLTAEEGQVVVDLVAWGVTAGAEIGRLAVELGSDPFTGAPAWPGRLDFDGSSIVLARQLNLVEGTRLIEPLRVASIDGGTVQELELVGVPSLAK